MTNHAENTQMWPDRAPLTLVWTESGGPIQWAARRFGGAPMVDSNEPASLDSTPLLQLLDEGLLLVLRHPLSRTVADAPLCATDAVLILNRPLVPETITA